MINWVFVKFTKTKMRFLKEMLQDWGFEFATNIDVNGQIQLWSSSQKSLVVFKVDGKLNVENIKNFVSIIDELQVRKGIIVCSDVITPKGKNIIDMINNIGDIKLETFHVDDFVCNKTKHRLVPKHEKLSREDAQIILKKYIKIPEILISDPISKYHGFEQGDVIKITRFDGSLYYRIVI